MSKNKGLGLISALAVGAGVAAVAAGKKYKTVETKKKEDYDALHNTSEYRNTERGKYEKNSKGIYYTNGNYEAFARPRKPEGVDDKHFDVVQDGYETALTPQVTVIGNGKAVGFVADGLQQLEFRRVMAEDDGIAAASNEDFFDALGQTDDRRFAASLADDRQGRMELAFAAVDDDQVRHGPILFAIAPFHDFRHGLKVIRLALDGLQFEAAILFLSRLTVLEDNHRGHGLYPLGMGNIEAPIVPRGIPLQTRCWSRT